MSQHAEPQFQGQQPPLDDDFQDVQTEKAANPVLLDEKALDPSFSFSHGIDAALRSRFQSPYLWSPTVKLLVLGGPFMVSMLASYSAGAYALSSEPLRRAWDVTDVQFNAGITLYVAGFAFAPMVLAPVSEAYGRYWIRSEEH